MTPNDFFGFLESMGYKKTSTRKVDIVEVDKSNKKGKKIKHAKEITTKKISSVKEKGNV